MTKTILVAAILKLCQLKKTLKDDRVASFGFLLFVVSGTRIHHKTLYILRITLHPIGCRTTSFSNVLRRIYYMCDENVCKEVMGI